MDLNLDLAALQSNAIAQPDPVVEAEKARKKIVQLAPKSKQSTKQESANPRARNDPAEMRQTGRAGKVAVQTYVSIELRRRLKVLAAQTDVTIEEYLAQAIEKLLTEHKA
jgi:hypothetical protein